MKKALFILSCSLMFLCCKKNDGDTTSQITPTSSHSTNTLPPKNTSSADTQAYCKYSGILYQYFDGDDYNLPYSDSNNVTAKLNMPLGDTAVIAIPCRNMEYLAFSRDSTGVYLFCYPDSYGTLALINDSLVLHVQYQTGCVGGGEVFIDFKGRKIR